MDKQHLALTFHILYGYAIDTGAATIRSNLMPSPPQNIGPENAVKKRMEPAVPAPFGR
jgi:hypothetical protein